MPIPFLDLHYQSALVANISQDIGDARTCSEPQHRARIYERLGNAYGDLHMYGRAMEMYRESMEAVPRDEVQERLATLLINLLGEQGMKEAEELTKAPWLRSLIEGKQQAIKRHQQKAALEEKHPAVKKIVGESEHILHVCKQIINYAPSPLPVLVTGPTGSGKEVVGKTIHACSSRKDKSFLVVNCAAIPEGLLESELFGHEKGAFTGAHIQRKGKFEQANGGTLFLDEVGDLSKAAQAKILRAIQEGEIWRVGGTKPIKVDVRFIAATNKNLAEATRNGDFRQDLYDRLNGGKITLKPLEERLEDLQPLVDHFIKKHELAREQAPYSSYDIFCWIRDYYLQADDSDQEDCEAPLTIEEIFRAMPRYDPDSRPEHHFQARKNVRTLEMAVQRAAARGTLRRYGNYAFIDVLEDNNVTAYGPRYYSNNKLQQFDWVIALALTRLQKEAGPLMEIHDPKKVSKTLKRLRLSKKQRKE